MSSARRLQRRRRPLSRGQRQLRSPSLPAAAELAYELALRAIGRQWARAAVDQALAFAKGIARPENGSAPAHDAAGAAKALAGLEQLGERLASSSAHARAARAAADATLEHSVREFDRLGIKLRVVRTDADGGAAAPRPGAVVRGINSRSDPKLASLVDDWRTSNVDRITGMLDEQRGRIVDLLQQHEGSRWEVIAKALQERLGITERRAALIARDQVLTLNAQVTRHRMKAAGVSRYIWTTAGDERVRGDPDGKYPDSDEDHYSLDGQTFSFDDPPVTNRKTGHTAHPGDDINCRCLPNPILDEFDEFADDDTLEPPDDEPPEEPESAPEGLDPGTHVLVVNIDGPDGQATFQAIQKVVTAQDRQYLEQKPLTALVIKPELRYQGTSPNGSYSPAHERIQVATDRPAHTFGKAFIPGGTWSVSGAGSDAEDARQRTWVHELGHHWHFSQGAAADELVQKAYLANGHANGLTMYARTSPEEYFAECFAMSRYHGAELAAHDPVGHKLVQDVTALPFASKRNKI